MKVRVMAAAAALAVAAGGGTVAAATVASAAPGPLQAALYANGTSTANWDMHGNPVLTAGATSGDSAQVDLASSYAGQPAPAQEPSFTASSIGGGDPRWVIELHNGCYLFGNPAAANSSTFTWSANPGGPQGTDYTTALNWAQSCGTDDTVTAAFIVDDSGYPGTAVTLTGVQYNGDTLQSLGPGEFSGIYSKVLDDYRSGTSNGTKVDLYSSNGTQAQQWTLEPDGSVRNGAAGQAMCLDDPGWGGQGTKVDMWHCVTGGQANEQWTYANGHLISRANGLCVNDPGYASANGTQQILWACGNYSNESFFFPAAG